MTSCVKIQTRTICANEKKSRLHCVSQLNLRRTQTYWCTTYKHKHGVFLDRLLPPVSCLLPYILRHARWQRDFQRERLVCAFPSMGPGVCCAWWFPALSWFFVFYYFAFLLMGTVGHYFTGTPLPSCHFSALLGQLPFSSGQFHGLLKANKLDHLRAKTERLLKPTTHCLKKEQLEEIVQQYSQQKFRNIQLHQLWSLGYKLIYFLHISIPSIFPQ